jgi:general secretion pathway protein G
MSTVTSNPKRPHLALIARRFSRGVTLVEVMIVVTILSLIAAGVAVAVLPELYKAQVKTTRMAAMEIRRAVETWRGAQGGDKCPTIQMLIQEKAFESTSKTSDAWDKPFRIVCEDDETVVMSLGKDGKDGTSDDIRVPEAQKP